VESIDRVAAVWFRSISRATPAAAAMDVLFDRCVKFIEEEEIIQETGGQTRYQILRERKASRTTTAGSR
jgi:hypothetical protein